MCHITDLMLFILYIYIHTYIYTYIYIHKHIYLRNVCLLYIYLSFIYMYMNVKPMYVLRQQQKNKKQSLFDEFTGDVNQDINIRKYSYYTKGNSSNYSKRSYWLSWGIHSEKGRKQQQKKYMLSFPSLLSLPTATTKKLIPTFCHCRPLK